MIDAVRAGGAVFPSFRCDDGAHVVWERSVYEMLGVAPRPSDPAVPYPDIWLIPQWRTDRILWNLPFSSYYQFVESMAAGEAPGLTLGSVRALLEEPSGRSDIRLHDLRWISLYQVNVRLAQRYRVNRVLLAGDAAHGHSSASGQGLNTSVQDSYNLLAVNDRSASGELHAGDRAPDGVLDDGTRLFDLFRGPHFTLLGFAA